MVRSSPHGIHQVGAAEDRAPEGSILSEAVDVGVGAAEERDGEKGRPLEGFEVLGGDEGCEDRRWNGGLWVELALRLCVAGLGVCLCLPPQAFSLWTMVSLARFPGGSVAIVMGDWCSIDSSDSPIA